MLSLARSLSRISPQAARNLPFVSTNASSTSLFCTQAAAINVTAVPRKKRKFAKPYETPDQILDNPMLQTILQQSGIPTDSPKAALDKQSKVAVLAFLSHNYDEPVPTNALPGLQTLEDIAKWYSHKLKPIGAMPHTRRFIHSTLGNFEQLEERIDLDTEHVHQEFLDAIPPNLTLDSKTYRRPDPVGLTRKRETHYKKMRRKAMLKNKVSTRLTSSTSPSPP